MDTYIFYFSSPRPRIRRPRLGRQPANVERPEARSSARRSPVSCYLTQEFEVSPLSFLELSTSELSASAHFRTTSGKSQTWPLTRSRAGGREGGIALDFPTRSPLSLQPTPRSPRPPLVHTHGARRRRLVQCVPKSACKSSSPFLPHLSPPARRHPSPSASAHIPGTPAQTRLPRRNRAEPRGSKEDGHEKGPKEGQQLCWGVRGWPL